MTRVKPEDLQIDKLPAHTRQAFLECIKWTFFVRSRWYLAGGTALLLQVGHRKSVDLDFFSNQHNFDVELLEKKLLSTNQWSTSLRREGTLYGTFNKAKISFIAYPFFSPSSDHIKCGHIRILLPVDIASMKIVAVSQRGRKRDFVDLYWYCTNRDSLLDVIRRATSQYKGQEHNLPHILKSLTYFDDAEADPMPELFFKANWNGIKSYFKKEVPKAAKELLGIK